jgi:hypothetical protein
VYVFVSMILANTRFTKKILSRKILFSLWSYKNQRASVVGHVKAFSPDVQRLVNNNKSSGRANEHVALVKKIGRSVSMSERRGHFKKSKAGTRFNLPAPHTHRVSPQSKRRK